MAVNGPEEMPVGRSSQRRIRTSGKTDPESDSVAVSVQAFHRAVAGATARLAALAVAMDDAFRCRPLRVVASLPSAPSGLRVGQSGPAISSAAKAGIPDRLGHARGYASALSPSVAEP